MIIQSFQFLITAVHHCHLQKLCMVHPEPEPTVNISILEDSNQNLTAGQKLLLEWHNIFCYLNFQSLQHVLRRAPFVAKGFAAAVKCDAPRCEICELVKAKCLPKKSLIQKKTRKRWGPQSRSPEPKITSFCRSL
jgi:hypothetical protein